MAAKRMSDDAHVCEGCGFRSPRWFGRCPECGRWSSARQPNTGTEGLEILSLRASTSQADRWATGLAEVDRVLGGGIVSGSIVLLAGDPGIGKSTLVLQLLDGLLGRGHTTLLVTGEESLGQVGLRAGRLGVSADRVQAAASSSLDAVLEACGSDPPDVLVVDSIQTLVASDIDQGAGSVVQVRECAGRLVRLAKSTGTAIVMVGHVTKEGTVAGPKTLEHMVDAVLSLEGDGRGGLRLLRALKNRFGSCDETGVFAMGERGLVAIEDPSSMLLEDRRAGVPGSVVFCGLEGTRPMLVELQALVTDSTLPEPRRVPLGVDARRLALLIGVLRERAGVLAAKHDVFVSTAGGLTVREPAADLAVCIALHSAQRRISVDPETLALGEVGLGGEVRRVPGIERRLSEAARLGFRRAIVPDGAGAGRANIELVPVRDLRGALRSALRVHDVAKAVPA